MRWAYEAPNTQLGETVVIEGPGQRGLLCLVAAREAGAGTIIVTGTANDAYRLELARQLGADITIDVDNENPVERVREATGGRGADVVVEVSAGATQPIVDAVDMVRRGGRIVLAGLKSFKPVGNLITDKIVINEIQLIGPVVRRLGVDRAFARHPQAPRRRSPAALLPHVPAGGNRHGGARARARGG